MTPELVYGIFVWVLGLCVGSFLNVVVYRLPLGLSIASPRWSFCPACGHTLRWRDNLPLIGWLVLRGRCRDCAASISLRYPLIEAATGLSFVLVYSLLFVEGRRVGLDSPHTPQDLPLLLAWLVLIAALVASSVMDLVSYVIDTRVTNAALYAGIALYAVWPRAEFYSATASSPAAAAACAALLTTALMLWLTRDRGDPDETPADTAQEPDAAHAPPTSRAAWGGVIGLVLMVALACWILSAATGDARGSLPAAPLALAALLALTVFTGGQPRQADEDLHVAIEEESPQARGVALRELLWLAPVIAAAAVAYALVAASPTAATFWTRLASWEIRGIAPIGGVAYAILGAMAAAAAGWAVRIVFTLGLGREAFGVGDIFILAAAGACIGWDLALLGFLLAVGIALLGWLLSLFLKRTAMMPFGPPLALGFVAALWVNAPAARIAGEYRATLRAAWNDNPAALAIMIGVALVGGAVSIVVVRLVRRFTEPEAPPPGEPPACDAG